MESFAEYMKAYYDGALDYIRNNVPEINRIERLGSLEVGIEKKPMGFSPWDELSVYPDSEKFFLFENK